MWRYNAEVHQGKEDGSKRRGCVGRSGCRRMSSWRGICSPGILSNQSASLLIFHLREFTPRGETSETRSTDFLGSCVHLSATKGSGLFLSQATWLLREEMEPQEERGSDCIIPVSVGDDDKGGSDLLRPNTHPGTGVSPAEVETYCYPHPRSSADSAKQWGLFQ